LSLSSGFAQGFFASLRDAITPKNTGVPNKSNQNTKASDSCLSMSFSQTTASELWHADDNPHANNAITKHHAAQIPKARVRPRFSPLSSASL
jgi:hypothetical protein